MEQARIIQFPAQPPRTKKSVREKLWHFIRYQCIAFYRFHRYMGVPPQTFWVINAATGVDTQEELQVIEALHRRFKPRKIDHLVIYSIQNLGYGDRAGEAVNDYEYLIEKMEEQPNEVPGGARHVMYVVWPTRHVDWDAFFTNRVDWIAAMFTKAYGGEKWQMGLTQVRMIPIDDLLEELNNP